MFLCLPRVSLGAGRRSLAVTLCIGCKRLLAFATRPPDKISTKLCTCFEACLEERFHFYDSSKFMSLYLPTVRDASCPHPPPWKPFQPGPFNQDRLDVIHIHSACVERCKSEVAQTFPAQKNDHKTFESEDGLKAYNRHSRQTSKPSFCLILKLCVTDGRLVHAR